MVRVLTPHLNKGVNKCCFRGQSKCWPLKPKAFREEFSGNNNAYIRLADSRFAQWQAEADPYIRELGLNPANGFEWTALAQHFGLATKMLDWSSNPLIALFFAISENEENDGEIVVWEFLQKDFNPQGAMADVKGIVLVRPKPLHSRLQFQQGLLSYHSNPAANISNEQLTRIPIPRNSKSLLQEQLYRMGIHHESIFCSLDDLSRKINWISLNHINQSQ